MFIAIVRHTPKWARGRPGVLIALGLSQARERPMSVARVTIVPLAMTALLAA